MKENLTIIKRFKNGKVSIKTIGWTGKRETFVIPGEVTFISVTYRRQTPTRKSKKKPKARRKGIRRLLGLG